MQSISKFFTLCLLLSAFIACNEAPKNAAVTPAQTDEAAITEAVHNFYKWYEVNAGALADLFFVKPGNPATIDQAKMDEHYAILAKSGCFSQTYIDAEKAYFKNLEATDWKTEDVNEGPLTGLDYDRFLCSQEMEDFKLLTTAPVSVQGLGTEKVTARMSLGEYQDKKYEMVKENGKWLISKVICE